MSDAKTKPHTGSVADFLARVPDEQMRDDCAALVEIMSAVTKCPPVMWGPSIVGFGTYRYVYATGREGDWPLTGFAPRKGKISVYVMSNFEPHAELMAKLGEHKTGMCCLYVKRLSDVHLPTLKKLIAESVKLTKKWQGCVPPEQQERAVKKKRGSPKR
jgi:hypothetical protein